MKYSHMGIVKIVFYWLKPLKMNGESKKKLLRLLLKWEARSRKEEITKVVGPKNM